VGNSFISLLVEEYFVFLFIQISCYLNQGGCSQGFTDMLWKTLVDVGDVDEYCCAYRALDLPCPSTCDFPDTDLVLLKAESAVSKFNAFCSFIFSFSCAFVSMMCTNLLLHSKSPLFKKKS
jgi:hypothetical protein